MLVKMYPLHCVFASDGDLSVPVFHFSLASINLHSVP